MLSARTAAHPALPTRDFLRPLRAASLQTPDPTTGGEADPTSHDFRPGSVRPKIGAHPPAPVNTTQHCGLNRLMGSNAQNSAQHWGSPRPSLSSSEIVNHGCSYSTLIVHIVTSSMPPTLQFSAFIVGVTFNGAREIVPQELNPGLYTCKAHIPRSFKVFFSCPSWAKSQIFNSRNVEFRTLY